MKYFFNLFYIAIILLYVSSKGEIKSIIPDEKLVIQQVQLNKEILLNIDIKNFEKLQKYKIMVHYIGSYAISFKISLICDDIYLIKDQQKTENIQLNDFSEFDFQTNEKKIPIQCGDDYDKNKVLLSLTPYSISYQFIPENEIKFNIIVELITNKFNTDIKPLNILFNKGLYRGIVFAFILVILYIVFQNIINNYLMETMNFNDIKKKK